MAARTPCLPWSWVAPVGLAARRSADQRRGAWGSGCGRQGTVGLSGVPSPAPGAAGQSPAGRPGRLRVGCQISGHRPCGCRGPSGLRAAGVERGRSTAPKRLGGNGRVLRSPRCFPRCRRCGSGWAGPGKFRERLGASLGHRGARWHSWDRQPRSVSFLVTFVIVSAQGPAFPRGRQLKSCHSWS